MTLLTTLPDEVLHIYRVMNDVNSKASAALSQSTKEFHAFRKDWDAVRSGMQDFHQALASDMEGVQDLVAKHWARLNHLSSDVDRIREVCSPFRLLGSC